MVDAIVSLAVQKLGDYLIEEAVSSREVKSEVEWLRDKLGWLLCFLKDAEEKQDGDIMIRKWVSDIRDAAYDAEDIIDSFILKVKDEDTSKKGFLEKLFGIYRQASLYSIGNEVKALRQRLDEISRNLEHFKIKNIGDAGEGSSRKNEGLKKLGRAGLYDGDDEHVVGFEEGAKLLMSELTKEEPNRYVISILGMGGLGKTTLARKLYNSTRLRKEFVHHSWVSVSQEYNMEDLLRRTIKSFKSPITKNDLDLLEKMKEEDLVPYLRKFLQKRRYLSVIDDVWEPKIWASLRGAFPDDKNGSRVIMTTRKRAVAEPSDDRRYVYELPFLNREESWELFCKKAFLNYETIGCCPPSLEGLGRDMVSKCGGLPLAIVVLGGLLSRKHPDDWPKVKEHVWRHVNEDNTVHVRQILALSFNDLPHHLKACFLYLGLFPEDSEIEADKLLRLWVAEGFIQPPIESQVAWEEDVALEYLNELIDRNLIQVARRSWRRIVSCRVHDLLRDLAISKAKELSFLHIYDGNLHSEAGTHRRRRRLAFHCGFERFVSFADSNLRLSTLLLFDFQFRDASTEIVEILSKKLRLLRVLDLKGSSKTRLPDSIGKLIHLRYLGLGNPNTKELSPSIGNLQALQTLHLDSHTLISLPREIYNAKQLKHLVGSFKWSSGVAIENLTNLQTLSRVEVGDDELEFNPVGLVNLRELGLRFTKQGSNGFTLDFIGGLGSLRNLDLYFKGSQWFPTILEPLAHCQHLFQLKLRGKIGNLPTEMHKFVPNLKYLFMDGDNEGMKEDPMPVLENLSKLTILDLINYMGKKLVCTARGFPQLEILLLFRCFYLEELRLDEGGMPLLRGFQFFPKYYNNNFRMPARLLSLPPSQNWTYDDIKADLWPY